jgi:hypothetical protein
LPLGYHRAAFLLCVLIAVALIKLTDVTGDVPDVHP